MGNQFTLLEQTGCPCSSTYMLQVYSATASASGPDTFTVQGPGNYDGLLVHVIAGVSGVAGVYHRLRHFSHPRRCHLSSRPQGA